jgi:hypothetical protein
MPGDETNWANRPDTDLADEAQAGLHGQGALVEMMRRLKDSNTRLTWVIVGLMVVQIIVAIVASCGRM